MQKPTKFNTRSFGRVGKAASGLLGGLLFSSGFVMTLPTALTTSAVVGGAAMIGAAMYSPLVAAQAVSQSLSGSLSAFSGQHEHPASPFAAQGQAQRQGTAHGPQFTGQR